MVCMIELYDILFVVWEFICNYRGKKFEGFFKINREMERVREMRKLNFM